MELNEYQAAAEQTAIYPTNVGVTYCILGLIGESGEMANKWKKFYRDAIPIADMIEELSHELGDVLWYVANLAAELGYSLEDIAQGNIAKLRDRQTRGVLSGDGDTR
jgi:NTP pyrophosphatase (non-canonical NTP hydrolase)